MTTEGKWNRFRNDNDLLIQLKNSKRIRLKKKKSMITREVILVVSRKKKFIFIALIFILQQIRMIYRK